MIKILLEIITREKVKSYQLVLLHNDASRKKIIMVLLANLE